MFEKNIERIDNIILKRRLQKITQVESRLGISYCITPSGDYILLKDDTPSDDLNNPREAIRKTIANTIKNEMKSSDFIITFGIGLGYLLDEVYNSFPSRIYIYEPDINLLHFVLSNVDISEHLASGRVFIFNDLEELIAKLSSSYITNDKVEIVYLQNYAIVKNKELLLLTQKVYESCKSKMVDVNTISKFSKLWLRNTIINLGNSKENETYLLSDLENKFIGQTALIAAAGPSLNDNIKHIQENRDKFVIFAVNKTVKYLIQNNITPDFIVCLDAGNMIKTLGGLQGMLNKSNCIMDARADANLHSIGFNKIFYSFSNTDFIFNKLAKYNKNIHFYESGGTASTLALTAAIKMGFSKIITAGLDLAFKENTIYSSGETMNRISQEKIVVDSVQKNLIKVESVTGGTVYTREDYATFIHHFETLIKELNYNELYNLSSFGAKINGFKYISFTNLNLHSISSLQQVELAQPYKFETQDFIKEEFREINEIIKILSKNTFSSALASAIVKSVLIYQYMQADILKALQNNFDSSLAEQFIQKTKLSIKTVVELLQKNKLA